MTSASTVHRERQTRFVCGCFRSGRRRYVQIILIFSAYECLKHLFRLLYTLRLNPRGFARNRV